MNIKSNNSTAPAFNQSVGVKCIKVSDTEQCRNDEIESSGIMRTHQCTLFHPTGNEISNLGAVELMQSPGVKAGSFSCDESSNARIYNNGVMQKEESTYPLLDENNVWGPFSF
jgi:hypothetical protein